jgi:hypothetical protein
MKGHTIALAHDPSQLTAAVFDFATIGFPDPATATERSAVCKELPAGSFFPLNP